MVRCPGALFSSTGCFFCDSGKSARVGCVEEHCCASIITEAEALFQEPFRTERKAKRIAATVLRTIRNHEAQLDAMSPKRRYQRIDQIFNKYLQGIHYTFVSSRPDSYQWNANCDTQVLRTCFNFGKAEIAAASAGSKRARLVDGYQGQANEQMRLAIQGGLAIALDEGAKPWDGHAKKICCGFGSPAEWRTLPHFTERSSLSAYQGFANKLLTIFQNAAVAAEAPCWSGNPLVCASGLGHPPEQYAGRNWTRIDCRVPSRPDYDQMLLKGHSGSYEYPYSAPAKPGKDGLWRTACLLKSFDLVEIFWLEKEEHAQGSPMCSGKSPKVSSREIGASTLISYSYRSKTRAAVVAFTFHRSGRKVEHPYEYFRDMADDYLRKVEAVAARCE